MAEYWNLDRLTNEWTARGLNRRELMRLIAGGAGMTALLTMMGTPTGAAAPGGAGWPSQRPLAETGHPVAALLDLRE
jgi:hypothetical protein